MGRVCLKSTRLHSSLEQAEGVAGQGGRSVLLVGDVGFGRQQDQGALIGISVNLGITVDGKDLAKLLFEVRLEVALALRSVAVVGAKLPFELLPRDGRRVLQAVVAVGEPDVDVNGQW